MASSGATPAAPSIALRPHARERDVVSASESVAFPELVWAHYLRQRALRENGELHGPAEDEFREQLDRFSAEQGTIINAYWCTREASAVAITEKPGGKILGLGFMWRGRPNIRFHAATDWATRDAPEISHALHKTETLAIRVSEVLSGTSERIAMQWLLSIGGYLLSVVDGSEKKVNRQELAAGGEALARGAGPGRVVLRPRGGEDGAARLLLGDADRNPRSGAGRHSRRPDLPDLRELQLRRPSGRGTSSSAMHRRGRRNRQRDDEDGVKRAAPGSSTTRWGGLRFAESGASGRSSARSSGSSSIWP